jgi:hypothetical protein
MTLQYLASHKNSLILDTIVVVPLVPHYHNSPRFNDVPALPAELSFLTYTSMLFSSKKCVFCLTQTSQDQSIEQSISKKEVKHIYIEDSILGYDATLMLHNLHDEMGMLLDTVLIFNRSCIFRSRNADILRLDFYAMLFC